jgi:hypothetical protein
MDEAQRWICDRGYSEAIVEGGVEGGDHARREASWRARG